jgi:hypothetical protein
MNTSQAEYPPNRVQKFLDTYAQTASISEAAKAAKITLAMHYQHLEADPRYRKAFEAAQQQAVDLLEAEAFRRALAGSDELLMFLLRAWRPERYQEHTTVEHSHSGAVTLVDEASAARGRLVLVKEQVQ